jgi:hypothetical protein
MPRFLLLVFLLFSISSITAQKVDVPSVFVDCQSNECFEQFLKQEVTYIDYVFDRQAADVHILVTDQNASAGAREVQCAFIYRVDFGIPADTIIYFREANISDLERQKQFVQTVKRGVLPLLLQSDLVDKISYEVDAPRDSVSSDSIAKDPWNYWSFELGLSLNVSGESSFNQQGFFTNIAASRIRKETKTNIWTWYNYDESQFTLSDGEVVESFNRRLGAFVRHVWSIDDHWSYGFTGFGGSSTFGNVDLELSTRAAVEYNIYPYSDNSTRRFTVRYSNGVRHNNYTEVTIFDRLEETRWQHGVDIEFNQNQEWGTLSFDVEFDQFLHDASLYSLSFNPNIELNIVKGLSLEFGGFISFVSDRINIAKGDVSDQDIILQNRQLDTNFSYFSFFGFNYRFGSQNNNIVNPRF